VKEGGGGSCKGWWRVEKGGERLKGCYSSLLLCTIHYTSPVVFDHCHCRLLNNILMASRGGGVTR
jgi:hypothetical protein